MALPKLARLASHRPANAEPGVGFDSAFCQSCLRVTRHRVEYSDGLSIDGRHRDPTDIVCEMCDAITVTLYNEFDPSEDC